MKWEGEGLEVPESNRRDTLGGYGYDALSTCIKLSKNK